MWIELGVLDGREHDDQGMLHGQWGSCRRNSARCTLARSVCELKGFVLFCWTSERSGFKVAGAVPLVIGCIGACEEQAFCMSDVTFQAMDCDYVLNFRFKTMSLEKTSLSLIYIPSSEWCRDCQPCMVTFLEC